MSEWLAAMGRELPIAALRGLRCACPAHAAAPWPLSASRHHRVDRSIPHTPLAPCVMCAMPHIRSPRASYSEKAEGCSPRPTPGCRTVRALPSCRPEKINRHISSNIFQARHSTSNWPMAPCGMSNMALAETTTSSRARDFLITATGRLRTARSVAKATRFPIPVTTFA